MTVTKILQSQAGIQYDKPQDKSAADPRDSLNNVVFTGQFKRGRFDKPMKVYASNLRAALGYDPDNMDYVAIEDALATGVPFVWVQRVVQSSSLICAVHSWSSEVFYIRPADSSDAPPLDQFFSDVKRHNIEVYVRDLSNENDLTTGFTKADYRYELQEGGALITLILESQQAESLSSVKLCAPYPLILSGW